MHMEVGISNGQWFREELQKGVRMFAQKMGRVIGASDGIETDMIYVEWSAKGDVHGRPILDRGLRMKGWRP